MIRYLVIRNMKITSASMFANGYVYGLPSTTGLCLFSHSLQRRLETLAAFKSGDLQLQILGTSQIIHYFEENAGIPKYTPAHPNQRAGTNETVAATVELKTCNFEQSLVMKLKTTGDTKNWLESERQFLAESISSMMFCGGKTQNILEKDIEIHDSVIASFKKMDFRSVALEGVGGRVLDQWDDEFGKPRDNQGDFAAMLACLDSSRAKHRSGGYLVPIAAGFIGLEKVPQNRRNARSDQHVFAEPLVGLAKFSNIASVKKRLGQSFTESNDGEFEQPLLFWKLNYENNCYYVSPTA
jgi:hypothetical protein